MLLIYVISSNKIIDQIKNISQEEKNKPLAQTEIEVENKICNIMESFWKYDNHMLRYYIKSNLFIFHGSGFPR